MKFKIAVGLLLAGLASTQEPLSSSLPSQIDRFVRETSNLSEDFQFTRFSNGIDGTYQVSYQNGPMSVNYNVKKTEEGQLKVSGFQQEIFIHKQGVRRQIQQSHETPQPSDSQFGPLPLLMPTFELNQENGQLEIRNVFDKIEKDMEHSREQFEKQFEQKFAQRKHKLIGGGDHDNWKQPHPMPGSGDHDMWQELSRQELPGSGNHDLWEGAFEDFALGADDHDDWQKELIGAGDHDWKYNSEEESSSSEKKDRRHRRKGKHHKKFKEWKKKITGEMILPYIEEKLPDLEGSEILMIENNGFQRKRGVSLDITLIDPNDDIYEMKALFRPRRDEFVIQTMKKVEVQERASNLLDQGKKLISEAFGKEVLEKPQQSSSFEEEQRIIPPIDLDFMSEQKSERFPEPTLLGGEEDYAYFGIPQELGEPEQEERPLLLGGENDPDNAFYEGEDKLEIADIEDIQDDEDLQIPEGLEVGKLIEGILDMVKAEPEDVLEEADGVQEKVTEDPKDLVEKVKRRLLSTRP